MILRKPKKGQRINNLPRQTDRIQYQMDLLFGLVNRELKLLYNRSRIGIAWTLIKPLLELTVFTIVFGTVLSVDIPNFASFIFIGIVSWAWFQSSISGAAGSIVHNRPLINQPNFPVSILPVTTLVTGLVHFSLSLPVLFVISSGAVFNQTVLLLPLLMLLQFIFTLSLSYFFAAINVVFRDTQHTLGVLLQMLFYFSGIFYSADKVPSEFQFWFNLNPMMHIINAYRSILLQGSNPSWIPLEVIFLASLILLPIGYQIFRYQSARFVEEV